MPGICFKKLALPVSSVVRVLFSGGREFDSLTGKVFKYCSDPKEMEIKGEIKVVLLRQPLLERRDRFYDCRERLALMRL